MPSASSPKLSIITVNRNMVDEIGATLESALAQDYSDFELIVIDGASSDGSQDIIASFGPRLSHWVSEPDRCLYDAMNKGVTAARGEWILFMNSGDRFAAPDVLSRVFAGNHDDADILYGHHVRVYRRANEEIERLILAEQPVVLPMRMNSSHQSLFMRRQLLLDRPFDIALLAADYDAVLAAYAEGKRFKPVDCVVARTAAEGVSDRHRMRILLQRFSIVRRHGFMTAGNALRYGLLMARAVAAHEVKKILPKWVVSYVLRHRPIKGLG